MYRFRPKLAFFLTNEVNIFFKRYIFVFRHLSQQSVSTGETLSHHHKLPVGFICDALQVTLVSEQTSPASLPLTRREEELKLWRATVKVKQAASSPRSTSKVNKAKCKFHP